MPRIVAVVVSLLALMLAGCPAKTPEQLPSETAPVAPISILVVDDPPLAEAIGRELSARLDVDVKMETRTSTELLAGDRPTADLLIYPPRRIGELVQRDWIVPLPTAVENDPKLDLDEIAASIRQVEIRWGERIHALPLGSPVLVLMLRQDVLDELKLEVPETWEDYLGVIAQIQSSGILDNRNDNLIAATIEPTAVEFLDDLWLVHSAAYVQHEGSLSSYFDFATGQPRIASAGFVRGAAELAQANRGTPEQLQSLQPAEVAQAFLAGRSVLALAWIHADVELPEDLPTAIAFAPVPGSREFYEEGAWNQRSDGQVESVPVISSSGMVGSVTSSTGQTLAAADVLKLLTSGELASLVSPASDKTFVYRTTSLPQSAAWLPAEFPGILVRDYTQVSMMQLQSLRPLSTIRLPQADRYRAPVQSAVLALLENESATAQEQLQQAAKAWEKIAEEIGWEEQKNAFRASQAIGKKAF